MEIQNRKQLKFFIFYSPLFKVHSSIIYLHQLQPTMTDTTQLALYETVYVSRITTWLVLTPTHLRPSGEEFSLFL